MAVGTYLFIANKAPKPPSSGAVTQTSGGGVANGTYSFLPVAWYRSRESDLNYCGFWKHGNMIEDNEVPTGNLAGAYGEYYTDWENVTVTGASDNRIKLKIQKVDAPVDHYRVYIQTASSLDLTAAVQRVAHAEEDNGDGTITLTIDDEAGVANLYEEYLVATAADPTNTFTLAGDVRSNFNVGIVNPVLDSSGAVTVTACDLTSSDSQLNTLVTSSDALNGLDTWVRYASGAKILSHQPPYIITGALLSPSPVTDRVEQPRQQNVITFNGVIAKKSYAKEKLIERVSLILPSGALYAYQTNQLLRCCRESHRMLLYDVGSNYTAYERAWYGKIESIDYLNTEGKRAREDFELVFQVEQGWSTIDDETENIIT